MQSSLPHASRQSDPQHSPQVGAHTGVRTTEYDSLLLKPTLPREPELYQLIRDGVQPDIDVLTATVSGLKPSMTALDAKVPRRAFAPKLPRRQLTRNDGDARPRPAVVLANGTATTIVLENLTYGSSTSRASSMSSCP